MQSYPSPMHRAYIIKFIPFTAPNAYHVVNVETKITHSMWTDPMEAKKVAADLNLVIKRERTMAVARNSRKELIDSLQESRAKKASHLRVVK